MTIRPIPGPWRIPAPFRARYIPAVPEAVAWTARCACGSGRDVTWLASRDGDEPITVHCTCAQEAVA